ncbi:MAG: hypothetical protein Q8918_15750 [Bacteroidota bacterium]|nr:hypothetical protein [Bacteroidota bacterium]
MAKTTEIGLSGSLGPLIFYKFRGVQCSRARPARVRLSEATRKSASLFGIASAMSATIRQRLISLLPAGKDLKIMYRLNAVIFQWLKAGLPEASGPVTRQPLLALYPFLDQNPAWAKMRVRPKIQWEEPGIVRLTLPKLTATTDLSAPPGTESVRMQIATLTCKAGSPSVFGSMHTTFADTPYSSVEQEAREIVLPLALQPGEVGLITLGLKYMAERAGEREVVASREWQPLDIIDAFYLPAHIR